MPLLPGEWVSGIIQQDPPFPNWHLWFYLRGVETFTGHVWKNLERKMMNLAYSEVLYTSFKNVTMHIIQQTYLQFSRFFSSDLYDNVLKFSVKKGYHSHGRNLCGIPIHFWDLWNLNMLRNVILMGGEKKKFLKCWRQESQVQANFLSLLYVIKSFAMFLFILGEKVVVLLGKHQMRAVLLSRKIQHQSVTPKLFH